MVKRSSRTHGSHTAGGSNKSPASALYTHKTYSQSVAMWDHLTDDNAWFLVDDTKTKIKLQPNQLLVPPALAKSAREMMEKTAAKVFNQASLDDAEDDVEKSKLDTVIDEQIKKLRK